MLKIGQNWGKIANYRPNAQQRLAPLVGLLQLSAKEMVSESCKKRRIKVKKKYTFIQVLWLYGVGENSR